VNKKNVENIYPLSPQQQGMLFECLYASEAGFPGAHIEQFTCALQGNLEAEVFKQAWQQTVERHSALRTAFVWKEQDEPLQVVLRFVEVPFEFQDWRHLTPAEQQVRLQAHLAADRQRGFELATAPLIRVAVFCTGDNSHQLAWTFHHILLDGWSQPLVLKDIFASYLALSNGQSVSLKPSRPYRDYIAWLKKQDLSETKRYWQEALRGLTQPTPLGVPAVLDGSPEQTGPYGYQFAHLPAELVQILQTWVQQQRLTLNTLAQGMWALLLSRYSDQDDVVFGTTVSGRPPDLIDVESMVGLFISSLPLRIRVSPQTRLLPWLQELQARQLDLQHYGYCSAGQIHRWSEMPGTLPLYESLLVFENYPVDLASPQFADLAFQISDMRAMGAQTNHALTLVITVGKEMRLQLVHQHQRLTSDSVSKIMTHFVDLLEDIATDPDQPLAALMARIPADQIPTFKPLRQIGSQASTTAYVAPRTPTEESLARIWAEVLGIDQVGIHHSFFELGGFSLLAIEVVSRVREAFQVELPLRELFAAPTIADLAVLITQKQAEQIDTDTLEQLLTELEQLSSQDILATEEVELSEVELGDDE